MYFNGTTLHFLVSTDNQFCGNVAQNDAKFFVRHSPIFKKKVRVTAPCASLMLAMHQSSEHAQLCNIASINQCRTLTIQLQCYEFFYLWFLCQDNPWAILVLNFWFWLRFRNIIRCFRSLSCVFYCKHREVSNKTLRSYLQKKNCSWLKLLPRLCNNVLLNL